MDIDLAGIGLAVVVDTAVDIGLESVVVHPDTAVDHRKRAAEYCANRNLDSAGRSVDLVCSYKLLIKLTTVEVEYIVVFALTPNPAPVHESVISVLTRR